MKGIGKSINLSEIINSFHYQTYVAIRINYGKDSYDYEIDLFEYSI